MSIQRLQGRLGVSQQEILKHINSNYEVKQGFAMMVKQALKRCVNKKILVQVKGGARGSFKVNKKIRRFSQVQSIILCDEYCFSLLKPGKH